LESLLTGCNRPDSQKIFLQVMFL